MSKEIKDYLHLYLGCEVIGIYNDVPNNKGYLTGVTNGGYDCEIQFILEDGFNVEEEPQFNEVKEIKPILRPLSDIDNEEFGTLVRLHSEVYLNVNMLSYFGRGIDFEFEYQSSKRRRRTCQKFSEMNAEQFRFLLSKHFDLFNLIPEGLAIDSTTLK